MNVISNSLELSEIANISHKAIKNLVKIYEKEVSDIGKIVYKKEVKNTLGGEQEHTFYEFTSKKQISYLAHKMKRKSSVSNVIDHFKLDDLKIVENRLENSFFHIIKSIVKGFQNFNQLEIKQDFTIHKYRIDYVIFNFGEPYIFIEYDEKHHKYNKTKDDERELEIIKYLNLENFFFERIKKGEELKGIERIVSILNSADLNLDASEL